MKCNAYDMALDEAITLKDVDSLYRIFELSKDSDVRMAAKRAIKQLSVK